MDLFEIPLYWVHMEAQAFSQAFQALNPAQKEAVERVFGPVMVVAGPGTGKTQVLALRIANILQKTDTNPQNILALTFTESGTQAMRERLLQIIGAAAHSVKICTFHSFCQDIISEFPEKFLFAKKLEPIDELMKIRLLRDILENSGIDRLRPVKNPQYFIKDILSLISQLKREDISPEKLREFAQAERDEFLALPETEKMNSKTGKMKGKYLELEAKISKYFELEQVYAAYQAVLQQEGFYDFDDMILFVLEKLKSDEDLIWNFREQYLFLLVDEFQDTNSAQMELVTLFAGDETEPNIFAVGDDDQSIYRFQGAALENILNFQEKFPQTKFICLTENYRSTQHILDLASSVIEQNIERLVTKIPALTKNLTAVSGEQGTLPQLQVFPQEEQEHFFISEKIQELHTKEKIPYAEIAVLVRNNSEGTELLRFFENQHLPAVFSGRSNALENSLVRQILQLLGLVANPREDTLFFTALHFPFFQVPVPAIWELWEKLQKNSETAQGKFWQFWCTERKKSDLVLAPEIEIFCEHLERWARDLETLTLLEFFQKICTESGIFESLIRSPSGIPDVRELESLNHLNALFSELKTFAESEKNADLSGFLERISLREEFALPLPVRELHAESDQVQILTAHKAKGLEFHAVFLIHAVNGRWGDQRKNAKLSLPSGMFRFTSEHDPNEEERRLFYVAATRAKEELIFTRSLIDQAQREKSESRFLSEIPQKLLVVEKSPASTPEQAFEMLKGQLLFPAQEEQKFPEEFLRRAVAPENFRLSFSAFENFRENPQKFLWENILRLPVAPHPSAALGTAVHRALEEFFHAAPTEREARAKEVFVQTLEREILTPTDRQKLRSDGLTALEKYFAQYREQFIPALHTEYNFRSHGVMLDGTIPLTGKVDKIEWLSEADKSVKVTDYKVTEPKSENEIRGIRDSDTRDITAGRYFRQLTFYALLCELSPRFPYHAEVFEIDFLLPTASGAYKKPSFTITAQEKEALKAEIRLVWQKIQSLDFRSVNLWNEGIENKFFDFLEAKV